MGLLLTQERKVPNFAMPQLKKCMNCGRAIELGKSFDIYTRRFCSVECKEDYCEKVKTI